MRDWIDQLWSQLSYYVDEVVIRLGLARDDPAVDVRRRSIVVVVIGSLLLLAGGWWYTTHTADVSSSPVLSGAAPVSTAETPSTAPDTTSSSDCNPNYSPCVPNVASDLNCGDIVYRTVKVVGMDHYEFDRDKDGYGCE